MNIPYRLPGPFLPLSVRGAPRKLLIVYDISSANAMELLGTMQWRQVTMDARRLLHRTKKARSVEYYERLLRGGE